MFRSPSAAEFGWGSAGLSTRFLETDDQGVAGGGALDADALDRMLLSGNQAAPADSWDSALGEAALPCDSEPGAAGEQPTAADLAQPQPPQAPATPVLCASSGGLLRCIDESHPQGCKRCVVPVAASEHGVGAPRHPGLAARPRPGRRPPQPAAVASSLAARSALHAAWGGGVLLWWSLRARAPGASHAPAPVRCTPAPLDPAGVELVGEHGKKARGRRDGAMRGWRRLRAGTDAEPMPSCPPSLFPRTARRSCAPL